METTALQRLVPREDVEAAVAQLIESRRADNTRLAYGRDWAAWRTFALEVGADLKAPTLLATTAFRARLAEGRAPATIARTLGALSFLYRALQDAGMVAVNPFGRAWLPRPVIPRKANKTVAIETEDGERVLAATAADQTPRGRRDLVILRLLYDTGMRRSSVQALRKGDILRGRRKEMLLRIFLKGGSRADVEVTPELEAAIAEWLPFTLDSPWLFPSARKKQPLDLSVINDVLDRRAREAGVAHVHPHRFRSAFVTTAWDAGVPGRKIQDAVHHATLGMTEHYDARDRGDSVVALVRAHRRTK